jgi:DNA-binding LacI/PurR family transcriptional regulator
MNRAVEMFNDRTLKTSPLVSSTAAKTKSLILSDRLNLAKDLQDAPDFKVSRWIVPPTFRKQNQEGRFALKSNRRLPALFRVNDQVAFRICEDLKLERISAPGQMPVTAFDGLVRWIPGGGFLMTKVYDFESTGLMATDPLVERPKSPAAPKHSLLDAPNLANDSATVASAPSTEVRS